MSERWTVYGLWAVLGLCVSLPAHSQTESDSVWTLVKVIDETPFQTAASLGWRVLIEGDYAFVSDPDDWHIASVSGAVHTYSLQHEVCWEYENMLKTLEPEFFEGFGASIASNQSYLAINSPGDGEFWRNDNAGAVYIFEKSPLGWQLDNKILPHSEENVWDFGRSISISGNQVLIGASGEQPSGSASVFQKIGDNWEFTSKLWPPDLEDDADFGSQVFLNNGIAIIGAPGKDEAFTDAGSVYIYEYNLDDNVWNFSQSLTSPVPIPFERFGASLDFNGNRIVVGSSNNDSNGQDSGAVYLFEKVGNNWVLYTTLVASDGAREERFGASVSLDGNRLLVGTATNRPRGTTPGKAYLFQYNEDGQWEEVLTLQAPDGHGNDGFGSSVDIENNQIVVGAWSKLTPEGVGAAYIYRLQPPNADPTADALEDIFTDDVAPPHLIDLDTVFSDADGDALLYSASVLAESGTTDWRIDGSLLTISFLQPGVEFITLEADDCKGGQAQTTLQVTVTQAPNFPPELAVAIPDRLTQERANDIPYDLSAIFRDPNRRDELTYTVTENIDPAAIATRIEDETLWLEVGQIGQTTLTVRCTDPAGEFAEGSFTVTVERGPNRPPSVAFPFPDLTADRLGGERSIHLYTIFSDPDGDELSFAVVSETNPGVVSHRFEGEFLALTYERLGDTELVVSATDPEGRSAADDLRVVVPVVASVPLSDGALSALYPNPATSTVELNLDLSEGPVQAQVYDVNGRLRLEKTLRSERERTLDVSALPAGVYVLKARQGQRLSTWKLLKR